MKKSTDYQVGESVTGTFVGDTTPCEFTKVADDTNRLDPATPGLCERWSFNGHLYEPTLNFQLGNCLPEFNPAIIGCV
jgi:hypothetical protein